jgi:rifampicin phosphotransferase
LKDSGLNANRFSSANGGLAVARSEEPRRLGPHWARLGSGRAVAAGAGNKAALLDRAARRGLAVPRGYVLLDTAFRNALRRRLVARSAGRTVAVADARMLLRELELPRFDGPIAVRSAFSAEDSAGSALAGFFRSQLRIDPRDPAAFVGALLDVWRSAERFDGDLRRDVLVMEMVAARRSGVAFSEPDYEDDLINHTSGTAERLVAGEVAGETLLLPRLRRWEHSAGGAALPGWARRLQRLLRGVRRVFGDRGWDIEWADDGGRCWLVQLRPVTRPVRRNELFTNANFKEILPELPSRFSATLVATTSDSVFRFYRRFDRSVPSGRRFVELFAGRPYFNLSLLSDLMRHWGLPTALVVDNLGGQIDRPFALNLPRALGKSLPLVRQGIDQWTGPVHARAACDRFLAHTKQLPNSYGGCIDLLQALYTDVFRTMLALTAGMSGPLVLLRRCGVLEEHAARQQTAATRMYAALDNLRALAVEHPDDRAALAEGRLPDDAGFQQAWAAFLTQHGTRAIYESDIARPRFHEQPESLLRTLAAPPLARRAPPRRTLLGLLTLPIWWQGARAISAREEVRYTATIAFDRLRARLLALARRSVDRGQLPAIDALWTLTIDEARRLDDGWQPDAAFFAARRAEVARDAAIRPPDLVHRFDDIEAVTESDVHAAATRLRGISLVAGEVRGRAWVLREPQSVLPDGFLPQETILVARSIDAGWIPTFAVVSGAVVETGGDLSHGSIVLREIGLPSVTNVAGATTTIRDGERLVLHASSGVVERLDADGSR